MNKFFTLILICSLPSTFVQASQDYSEDSLSTSNRSLSSSLAELADSINELENTLKKLSAPQSSPSSSETEKSGAGGLIDQVGAYFGEGKAWEQYQQLYRFLLREGKEAADRVIAQNKASAKSALLRIQMWDAAAQAGFGTDSQNFAVLVRNNPAEAEVLLERIIYQIGLSDAFSRMVPYVTGGTPGTLSIANYIPSYPAQSYIGRTLSATLTYYNRALCDYNSTVLDLPQRSSLAFNGVLELRIAAFYAFGNFSWAQQLKASRGWGGGVGRVS